MKKFSILFFCCAILCIGQAYAQVKKAPVKKKATSAASKTTPVKATRKTPTSIVSADKSIKVKITTDSGVMVVKLYDSTPLHRDNFVKLVDGKFYDSLMFHRVIQGFMIQGGDPLSKNAQPGQMLGNGGGDMARIPAEFRQSLVHKKGVLAAARDGNPEKASSACQFYLVQGRLWSDEELNNFEARKQIKYSPEQRLAYKTIGGTPMLDQDYTVYGEVISGMEVIDKIASVAKAPGDRPTGDVRMKMEVIRKNPTATF